jgi:hypothetical protein
LDRDSNYLAWLSVAILWIGAAYFLVRMRWGETAGRLRATKDPSILFTRRRTLPGSLTSIRPTSEQVSLYSHGRLVTSAVVDVLAILNL